MNAKNIVIGAAVLMFAVIVIFAIGSRKSGAPGEGGADVAGQQENQVPLDENIDEASEMIISEILQETEDPLPEEDLNFLEEDAAAYEEEAFGEF